MKFRTVFFDRGWVVQVRKGLRWQMCGGLVYRKKSDADRAVLSLVSDEAPTEWFSKGNKEDRHGQV